MASQRFAATLLVVVLCAGCQSSFSSPFTQIVGYRNTGSARENPADQTSDPWIQEAGDITSAEHDEILVNDPLKLRKIFVSPKARDIERNLGVKD
ncbi:hypothetical protein [Thalassoglobus sp.]|uniref:hypothetical protein n=1 Tax=Thalassoglobus sp. TaxID=2795869 RepID=UPI003AA8F5C0